MGTKDATSEQCCLFLFKHNETPLDPSVSVPGGFVHDQVVAIDEICWQVKNNIFHLCEKINTKRRCFSPWTFFSKVFHCIPNKNGENFGAFSV